MPEKPIDIHCRNRQTDALEVEATPHEALLNWLYGSAVSGWLMLRLICSRRWFSRVYGWYLCDRTASQRRIEPFVREHGVDLALFESGPFSSFNEFFIRRFRDGVRRFTTEPTRMPAWAEGVCLAWSGVDDEEKLPVKQEFLTAADLMGDADRAAPFRGGPVLIIRLRPADYHRFHFVDDGPVVDFWDVPGGFHSVNPRALGARPDILARNARQVSVQQSRNFGLLAYVEIGAMAVGRIVQSSTDGGRGQEKGRFECGGSTVAILGVPGAWTPDEDLLEWTGRGIETQVELGTPIAAAGGHDEAAL